VESISSSWPGLSRPSTPRGWLLPGLVIDPGAPLACCPQDVDARHKAGHDDGKVGMCSILTLHEGQKIGVQPVLVGHEQPVRRAFVDLELGTGYLRGGRPAGQIDRRGGVVVGCVEERDWYLQCSGKPLQPAR